MKHLFTQLGAALIMLFALNVNAQTMVGLPEHGVTLSGTAAHPVINNASGRDLLGYVLHFSDAQGNGPVYPELTTNHIRRGEPVKTSFEFARSIKEPNQPASPGMPHNATSVTLDAVVFADGEYVSGHTQQTWDGFQLFAVYIEAEKALGQMLAATRNNQAQQGAAWAKVYALAEMPTSAETSTMESGFKRGQQHIVARDLVATKSKRGDDAAFDMADRLAKLSSVWRKAQ